jgi:hypothetical protein
MPARQKSSKKGHPPGAGVACRHQPVGRTGQSARKIFSGVKIGRGKGGGQHYGRGRRLCPIDKIPSGRGAGLLEGLIKRGPVAADGWQESRLLSRSRKRARSRLQSTL